MNRTPQTDWFWQEFTRRTGVCGRDYVPVRFGDTDAMANALLALVLAGTIVGAWRPKSATAAG